VHTSPQASELNRNLSSKAFTTGNDIFLRSDVGASDPRLLAHELTHVVQQRSMDSGSTGLQVGPAGDAYEHEADSADQPSTVSCTTFTRTSICAKRIGNSPAMMQPEPSAERKDRSGSTLSTI
jgi:hypothetical protein